MPNRNQQLAGDDDHGFVASQAGFQALEFGDPVREGIGSCLGSFDQGGAQVAATGFGDAPAAGGQAGFVDAPTQPGETDYIFNHYSISLEVNGMTPPI